MEELHTLAARFYLGRFSARPNNKPGRRGTRRAAAGCVLTVGFAFDANAGLKPDAPIGWQRAGLTVLFRLISEPRRLGPRYLLFNTLFLIYLLGRRTARAGLGQRATFRRVNVARRIPLPTGLPLANKGVSSTTQ
jgi:hypothetical protein